MNHPVKAVLWNLQDNRMRKTVILPEAFVTSGNNLIFPDMDESVTEFDIFRVESITYFVDEDFYDCHVICEAYDDHGQERTTKELKDRGWEEVPHEGKCEFL